MQKTSGKFIVLLAIFIIFQAATLKDGHNWGGDFSQYILHAQNILEGNDYASGIMLAPGVSTAPGFPLIIAPVLKVFGLNFIVLKFLNIIFWGFFVFFMYMIAKERQDELTALLVSVFLFSSFVFFTFKQNVLSDIPFLTFLTGSIYFFSVACVREGQNVAQSRSVYLILSLAMMSFAFLIRWAGICLFISAILYCIIAGKGKRFIPAIAVTLLLVIGVQQLIAPSGSHYMVELQYGWKNYFLDVWDMMTGRFMYIIQFYVPQESRLSVPIYLLPGHFFNVLSRIFFIFIFYLFAYRSIKKKISFGECFLYIYLLAMILWTPQGEGRYILPVVGPLLLLMIEGIYFFKKYVPAKEHHLKNAVVVCMAYLILNNASAIALNFGFNDDEIYGKDAREMVQWVKQNTAEETTFMFRKPRVFKLLTGRMSAPFGRTLDEIKQWDKTADQYGITHVVFESRSGTLIEKAKSDGIAMRPLWDNKSFIVYRLE